MTPDFEKFIEEIRQKLIEWSNKLDDLDWKIVSYIDNLDFRIQFILVISINGVIYEITKEMPDLSFTHEEFDRKIVSNFFITRMAIFSEVKNLIYSEDYQKFTEVTGINIWSNK